MPIALIPARQSSQGIPNKNFTPLLGITPVMRAVTCCFGAGIKAYVSSNAPNTEQWRWWVDRPVELAQDDTPMRDVILHFLGQVEGPADELILLVQPTQPLRQPKHLVEAIALSEMYHQVTSIIETTSIQKLYIPVEGRLHALAIPRERRQGSRRTFQCDGTVYTFRRGAFLTQRVPSLQVGAYPFIIPPEESCPLDTPLDWHLAEFRLKDAARLEGSRALNGPTL